MNLNVTIKNCIKPEKSSLFLLGPLYALLAQLDSQFIGGLVHVQIEFDQLPDHLGGLGLAHVLQDGTDLCVGGEMF